MFNREPVSFRSDLHTIKIELVMMLLQLYDLNVNILRHLL
jgi:hypothetical protein